MNLSENTLRKSDFLSNRRLLLAVTLILALNLAVVAFAQYSSEEKPQPQQSTPKVALIVFDGADWEPINQLREKNRLPEFQRMMDKGIYGNLSTPVAFSPISWTKAATGLGERKVNIEGWNTPSSDGTRRMIQSSDVKNKRLWNYLNSKGIKTGIVGWLVTWPVEPVKGFMVSGPLATSNQTTVYPKEYFKDQEVSTLNKGNEWENADIILENYKEDVSFLALGFKRLDTVQHQLWKFVEPGPFGLEWREEDDKYREVVYSEYENLDQVMSRFDDSWNVIVVSDSGFEPEGQHSADTIEEYRSGKAEKVGGYPTYEANLNPILAQLGYLNYTEKIVYGQKVAKTKSDGLEWCALDFPYLSNTNQSNYYFNLCINKEGLDVNQAISKLEQVDYRDGREFIHDVEHDKQKNVIRGQFNIFQDGVVQKEINSGYVNQPTASGKILTIDKALGLELPNGSSYDFWIGPEKSGDHPSSTDGIFLAEGPDIADKGKMPDGNFRVVDIAPTILYMYGKPIPREMDGRVVTEMFTEEFNSQNRIILSNNSTEINSNSSTLDGDGDRQKALKQKLRNLGYLN